jgi:DNA-binding PadR family transcriptional regulator
MFGEVILYLRSKKVMAANGSRRIYSITPKGKSGFGAAREKVRELFGELFAQALGAPALPPVTKRSESDLLLLAVRRCRRTLNRAWIGS